MHVDSNLSFFIRTDLKRYAGQYVAIARGKVVASGKKLRSVYALAKKKFPKGEIALWREPKGDYFIFRFTI